MPHFRPSAAFVALAITLWSACCALSVAGEPGIVGQRPAEGRFVQLEADLYMVPYQFEIPGSQVIVQMVPIEGGAFSMGSPDGEPSRGEDEGPQVQVEIQPFWMSKYEATWSEYHLFMSMYDAFKELSSLRTTLLFNDPNDLARMKRKAALTELLGQYPALNTRLTTVPGSADLITAPTKLYMPSVTYESGDDPRQPAVTMTQYAAKQYTKWLAKLTGQMFRLPTEAEWEYACRADTTTAFSFGDDAESLGEYAWFYENSDELTHQVGGKKPNAWGLHDMHGNAAEWVIDAYDENGYAPHEGESLAAEDAIVWPTAESPRVVRGGSWDDDAQYLRSAARLGSDAKEWKSEDPNLPLSPWWFTSYPAGCVGFRIIRPLTPPDQDMLSKFWEIDVDSIRFAVTERLREGRGIEAAVTRELPEVIDQLDEVKAQVK
jgi:sulfatase modifying factor 1